MSGLDPSRPPLRRRSTIGGRPGDKFRLTVLTDGLLRYEWAPDGHFEDRPSSFAYTRDNAGTDEFELKQNQDDDWIDIVTSRFQLTFDTAADEFAPHNLYCLVFGHTGSLWRYGYNKPWENLGGTTRTLDGIDGRADWGTGIVSQKGYTTIDDSSTMLFDQDGLPASRRPGSGRVDGYLFAYGHDYRDAIKAFYLISGCPPVLPRWALGNWWSRYYPYSEKSYLALMDEFRARNIPLSVAVLDMDWHLVRDPRVIEAGQTGWTGYTWNKELFPDPQRFLSELHKRGLKTTLNEHPSNGVHSYEDLYPEFAKAMGIDPLTKEGIPFDITNRKYMRAYFDILLQSLECDGCDFWWIDWQQGEHSRLQGVDPLWVLNHFHFEHIKGDKMPRPLILSRYAGPGSHRYPIGFSGDTVVSWASLRFQPAFTATASNIGYGWWSHDIGGHFGGTKDVELTTRWVQLGVFSPILRLHSSNTPWVSKEPWKLPAGGPQETVTEFLRMRHQLLPYLHSMNIRASREGLPLVQPMYWEYPWADVAYCCENQYLFGSCMMVMAITEPSDPKLGLAKTKGWLPPGRYVDYFTGTVYSGDRELWISRPLRQYPVFMKEGSIAVLQDLPSSDPESQVVVLEVLVVVGADGKFVFYDDVAAGKIDSSEMPGHITKTIEWKQTDGKLTMTGDGSSQKKRSWLFILMALSSKTLNLALTSSSMTFGVPYNDPRGLAFLVYEVADDEPLELTLREQNGNATSTSASLRNKDSLDNIEEILEVAQIEYALKENIWAALNQSEGGRKPTRLERLSGLEAIEMNQNLRLAIVELLMADINDG